MHFGEIQDSVFLKALSWQEKQQLFSLDWKQGKLADLTKTSGYTFFLISGRILEKKKIIAPEGRLLGVLPFVDQETPDYEEYGEHLILFISTDELAAFFLRQPRAMTAYLRLQEHFQHKILREWNRKPDISLVVTDDESQESVFLSWKTAVEQKKKYSNVLYIEGASSGSAIFSFLNLDVPAAIVQSKEEEVNEVLTNLIQKRLIKTEAGIDVLNLHFLSPWQIMPAQWGVLYHILNQNYEAIVIHAANQYPAFLVEQVDRIFYLNSQAESACGKNLIEQPRVYYPPLMTIGFSGNKCRECIRHPVHFFSSPEELSEHRDYDTWYSENLSSFLGLHHTVILGDSYGNVPGLLAVLHRLASGNKGEVDLKNLFQRFRFVFKGWSAILGALAAVSESWEHFVSVADKISKRDVMKLFKPVFPGNGFYDSKPLEKYFSTLLGEGTLEKAGIFLSLFSHREEQLRWLSSGEMHRLLLTAAFPYSVIRINTCDDLSDYAASDDADAEADFAYALRYGMENVDYYFFDRPTLQDEEELIDYILWQRSPLIFPAGAHSMLYRVKTSTHSDIWLAESEIFKSLSPS